MYRAKVLVVEDEMILGKGIELMLQKNGYDTCRLVPSGEEALEVARSEKPDLALLDIALEGELDGIATAERLRSELDIPCIFLTAYGDDATVARARAAEPYSYILKPFDEHELVIALDVVCRKDRAQRALRERERRLDAVLRSIGDAVLTIDREGKITAMNTAAEAITGCRSTEAVGQSVSDVLRLQDASGNSIVTDPSLWTRGIGGKHLRAFRRDGETIPVEGVCSPIRDGHGGSDGYVCAFRDISARKAAEDRVTTALTNLEEANATVERKRALLHAIVQSIPCGVVAVDREYRVRAINPFLEQLLGLEGEPALGKPLCVALACERTMGEKRAASAGDPACSCALREAAESAFRTGSSARKEGDFKIGARSKSGSLRLAVGTTLGRLGDEELCFLLLEDRTEIDALRRALRTEVSFSGIVGRDGTMHDLFETIRDLADSTVPVLVHGESGTGKELVATAIHSQGPRAAARFVAVNCGALPDTLLESELFGYVKGAFTGAVKDRKGRFELADGGTLFLDEVGELSPSMQVKLLRVVQNGTFERLGSENSISVDVRIISATNRDLEEEVARGRFRRDLFYRLCVVPVMIPPLRERSGDIPLLVDHILSRMAKTRGKDRFEISSEALALLMEHTWPGNVRELENVLQFAFVKSRGERVNPEHLPVAFVRALAREILAPQKHPRLTADAVAEALRATHGNRLQAAKRLDVSRATLYRFLAEQAGERVDGAEPEE